MFCDGQGTGQAGRFDAQQVHEAIDAMVQGAIHPEIGGRLTRTIQLGTYIAGGWL